MVDSPRTRRIKFVRPGLQTRLVLSFLGVSALAMLMQAMLLGWLLTSMANELPSVGDELSERLPTLLIQALLLSAAVFLPLLFWVGVRTTFSVAGPISKFESYLGDVRDGRATGPCRIRRTDELHELCGLINDALEAAKTRAKDQGQVGDAEQDAA